MTTKNNETWKDIPEYEGLYQCSDQGQVRSLDKLVGHNSGGTRLMKGKILKNSFHKYGYPKVELYKNKKPTSHAIHRLVALTFMGPKKDGQCVRHIDGNPKNNLVENLSYGTQAENMQDCVRHGKTNQGSRHPSVKLTEEQARMIKFGHKDLTHKAIAEIYNVSRQAVTKIKGGIKWAHLTDNLPADV